MRHTKYLDTLHATACENARKAGRRGDVALTDHWLRIARECVAIEDRLARIAERDVETELRDAEVKARIADAIERTRVCSPVAK